MSTIVPMSPTCRRDMSRSSSQAPDMEGENQTTLFNCNWYQTKEIWNQSHFLIMIARYGGRSSLPLSQSQTYFPLHFQVDMFQLALYWWSLMFPLGLYWWSSFKTRFHWDFIDDHNFKDVSIVTLLLVIIWKMFPLLLYWWSSS